MPLKLVMMGYVRNATTVVVIVVKLPIAVGILSAMMESVRVVKILTEFANIQMTVVEI